MVRECGDELQRAAMRWRMPKLHALIIAGGRQQIGHGGAEAQIKHAGGVTCEVRGILDSSSQGRRNPMGQEISLWARTLGTRSYGVKHCGHGLL